MTFKSEVKVTVIAQYGWPPLCSTDSLCYIFLYPKSYLESSIKMGHPVYIIVRRQVFNISLLSYKRNSNLQTLDQAFSISRITE